jgi:hypothetical protein
MKDSDLHVGAVLPILGRIFKLLEADEYTYQFMENSRHKYKMADADLALQRLEMGMGEGVRKGHSKKFVSNA